MESKILSQQDLCDVLPFGKTKVLPQNMSLHTLRHTFGSVLIRRGVSVEVVSKLMGHANIMITYNKYIHVLKEQEALAMDMITIS